MNLVRAVPVAPRLDFFGRTRRANLLGYLRAELVERRRGDGGTASQRRAAHRTRLFGLRFDQSTIEQEYQRWRVVNTIPFARVGYIGSTPSWILLLVAVVTLDPDAADQAASWIIGWILLLVVLTALTFPTALRRTVTPLSAAANCLAGFLIVWLLSDVTLADQASQSRAGIMTAGVIVVMFFGFAVFRNPPGAAIAAVTPYVAFGVLQLGQGYDRGELDPVEAGSFAAALGIAYLGCLLVCIVMEVVGRQTFCKDRIIATQKRELSTSREAIRRYVPRPVFEHIARGDAAAIDIPTRRRVTVLFADLVGFTALADRVEGEDLTQVINDYMTAMSQLVDDHGGIVNEFAGDGLMALFGAPDEMTVEDQVLGAVQAARAMQSELIPLNRSWHRLGVIEPMQTRIGIDTGMLSVGSFGSAGRMTYTAIGLHTNIAARLQASCEPGQVFISEASWYLVKDRVPCEPRGEVQCKGVHYPVRAYSPLNLAASREREAEVVQIR